MVVDSLIKASAVGGVDLLNDKDWPDMGLLHIRDIKDMR